MLEVLVDVSRGQVQVRYDPARTSRAALAALLERSGWPVHHVTPELES